MKIILASGSPRRTEILKIMKIEHTIQVADVDESPLKGERPIDLSRRLAEKKALAVSQSLDDGYVIGSDTIVVLGEQVLGKPDSDQSAIDMLMRLSGRSHEVMTGVAVVNAATGLIKSQVSITKVVMKAYNLAEAQAYVATGEPLDKAGAYGIQGIGSVMVDHMEGEFYSVAGLSVQGLLSCFSGHGLSFFEDLSQQ